MTSFSKTVIISLTILTPSGALAGWWEQLTGPDNYWECLLKEMPGTFTYGGALEKLTDCRQRFPDKTDYRSGNGLFGPRNYQDCVGEALANTKDPLARRSIRNACYHLFPPD